MAGRGHATAAPRRVRKSRRLMTNLRVDPLHFSPEPRWRALAPLEPRSSQLLRRRALLARVGGGASVSRGEFRGDVCNARGAFEQQPRGYRCTNYNPVVAGMVTLP